MSLRFVVWLTASLAVYQMFAFDFRRFPVCVSRPVGAPIRFSGFDCRFSTLILRTNDANDCLYYRFVFDRSVHFGRASVVLVLILFFVALSASFDRILCGERLFRRLFLAHPLRLIQPLAEHFLRTRVKDTARIAFVALAFAGWE